MKTMQGRFRAAVLMGAAVSMMVFAVGAKAQSQNSNDNLWPYDNPLQIDIPFPFINQSSPVLAVVGDISCQPGAEVNGEASPTFNTMTGAQTATGEVCTDSWGDANGVEPLWQSQEATANEIETMKPDAVALLGDLQYQVGRYSDFEGSFDLTYGAFKFLHRPAPGNHEFYDEHGETGVGGYGYFSYYNGFQLNSDGTIPLITISNPCPVIETVASPSCKAGKTAAADLSPQPIPRPNGQAGHFAATGGVETGVYANGPSKGDTATVGLGDGWYSYNIGSWHLISLNIECYTQPDVSGKDGCAPGNSAWFTSELAWLKKDLEENHSACTLAYWHQPAFSATDGVTEEGTTSLAFWQLLYKYGADLVLNGHDHLYAHYRPLDPSGNYDPKHGIREFIVGTGGETLDPVVANSTSDAGAQFNLLNLENPTGGTTKEALADGGKFWGVMALTLEPNGYKWDFESALQDTQQTPSATSFSDKGVGYCHGGPFQFGF